MTLQLQPLDAPATEPARGPARRRRGWALTALAGTAVGAGVTAYLLSGSLAQIPRVLTKVSLSWVAIAFGLLAVANVARSHRMAALLGGSVGQARSFDLTCRYNVATAVLPGGLGELTLPVMLSRRDGIGRARAASTLLVTRLLDVVGLLAVALVSAAFTPALDDARWPVVAVTAVTLAAFAAVVTRLDRVATRLAPPLTGGGRLRRQAAERLRSLAAAVTEQRAALRPVVLADTALMWVGVAAVQVALARSVGAQLPWAAGGVAAAVIMLLAALPFRSLAGLGVQEAGWTLVLSALAADSAAPAAHALAIHAVTLACMAALWLVGLGVGLGARWAATRGAAIELDRTLALDAAVERDAVERDAVELDAAG